MDRFQNSGTSDRFRYCAHHRAQSLKLNKKQNVLLSRNQTRIGNLIVIGNRRVI